MMIVNASDFLVKSQTVLGAVINELLFNFNVFITYLLNMLQENTR